MKKLTLLLVFWALPAFALLINGQSQLKYKDLNALNQAFKSLESKHPNACKLHKIANSPGGNNVFVLEIGKQLTSPAIFVAANLDGTSLISTEAALRLSTSILSKTLNRKWFILYNANPDASLNFFKEVKNEDSRNLLAFNDDKDEQIDEDGANDLNGDGLISLMKVPDPNGEYIIDEQIPGLLRKANKLKGEKGSFKLITEGTDDDGDGKFNEDPTGGVNVNENFPHQFKHFTKTGGEWPGSTPEAYGIMRFIYQHPEIIMAISLGNSDYLLDIPKPKKYDVNPNQLRLSKRQAGWLGLEDKKNYTLEEIKTHLQESTPQRTISTSYLASMLSLGEISTPFESDIDLFIEVSKAYSKHLKNLPKTISTPKLSDGSFEKWAYFHLGIPSFAINVWAAPLSKDSTIKKEYIDEASLILNKENLLNKGFVDWKEIQHPQLGTVEIGGIAPFAAFNPLSEEALEHIDKKLEFISKMTEYTPSISLMKTELTKIGNDVYKLEVWIENKSFFPYPIFMGRWNGQAKPIVLSLEDNELSLIDGKKRLAIHELDAYSVKKVSWIFHKKSGNELKLNLHSEQGWKETKLIKL